MLFSNWLITVIICFTAPIIIFIGLSGRHIRRVEIYISILILCCLWSVRYSREFDFDRLSRHIMEVDPSNPPPNFLGISNYILTLIPISVESYLVIIISLSYYLLMRSIRRNFNLQASDILQVSLSYPVLYFLNFTTETLLGLALLFMVYRAPIIRGLLIYPFIYFSHISIFLLSMLTLLRRLFAYKMWLYTFFIFIIVGIVTIYPQLIKISMPYYNYVGKNWWGGLFFYVCVIECFLFPALRFSCALKLNNGLFNISLVLNVVSLMIFSISTVAFFRIHLLASFFGFLWMLSNITNSRRHSNLRVFVMVVNLLRTLILGFGVNWYL